MRVVTFKVDRELGDLMDMVARVLGLSRSELIRDAIWWYISDQARRRPEVRRIVEEWRRRREKLRREAEERAKREKILIELSVD